MTDDEDNAGAAREPQGVAGTALILLEQARSYVVAESGRATGLQNRATAGVATAGVVLGLTVSTAKDLFARDVPVVEFRIIFIATLVVLFVSALLSGIALWPPGSAAAPIEEVEDYVLPEAMSQTEPAAATSLVSALAVELAGIRESNDYKSRLLRGGLVLLVFGALLAGVQGAAIGLTDEQPTSTADSGGATMEENPASSAPKSSTPTATPRAIGTP